jgi:hypothetical protein
VAPAVRQVAPVLDDVVAEHRGAGVLVHARDPIAISQQRGDPDAVVPAVAVAKQEEIGRSIAAAGHAGKARWRHAGALGARELRSAFEEPETLRGEASGEAVAAPDEGGCEPQRTRRPDAPRDEGALRTGDPRRDAAEWLLDEAIERSAEDQ